MNVDTIIDGIIQREGGYSDHDLDRGGSTKYGITQETLGQWRGEEVTEQDVKKLAKEEAHEIYKQKYYYKPGIHRLPSSIQEFTLDSAVHSGPTRAISFVQRVCNKNGFECGVVDGVIGPKTLKASFKFDRMFLDELIEARENFLLSIIENDPSQAVFATGWMNRIEEFRG